MGSVVICSCSTPCFVSQRSGRGSATLKRTEELQGRAPAFVAGACHCRAGSVQDPNCCKGCVGFVLVSLCQHLRSLFSTLFPTTLPDQSIACLLRLLEDNHLIATLSQETKGKVVEELIANFSPSVIKSVRLSSQDL